MQSPLLQALEDERFEELLGVGTFSEVFKVRDPESGNVFAVKRVS